MSKVDKGNVEGVSARARAQPEHSISQTSIGAPPQSEQRDSEDPGLNIKFTPESQVLDSQTLDAMLHGPQGLSQLQSQDPLMQTQECSLQQEMLRAQETSTERDQNRAQETAAALRGEAAQAAVDPSAVVADTKAGLQLAAGGMVDVKQSGVGDDTAAAVAAAAAAAAAGGIADAELLKLAQAAEQQGYDPTTYAALQQQAYDPNWAAFASMPMAMGMPQAAMMSNYYWGQPFQQQQYQQRHSSLSKLEHANSNAKRRGPMDEMRQLQRILTKLLPGSVMYMPNQDGGGNKVQADDIKVYIAATLGEAPKPDWGLKNGWGQYLADLFNWATGRDGDDKITREAAMSCARRPQGRSWEVVFDKLMELGIYSWNWELPLNHQQVLNCHKTPPPELTRQQEALAAATAAAAAAAAVTAGATPDTIPNLPVVARMASLLGKRQHQQMAPMSSMSMGPPPMMFAPMAMDMSGMEGAAGSVATSAAAAAAAPAGTAVESTVEATAEDRAVKQQRSSSAGPPAAEATGSAGGAPVPQPGTPGKAPAAAPQNAVSDAELAVPPPDVLQNASVQQLMTYADNALSSALQALQTKVMSGTARCPSMEYVMNMKNFKLDPLYASFISLVLQASSGQAAMEQHMAQQAALQQAKIKVKGEAAAAAAAAASSQPVDRAEAAAAAADGISHDELVRQLEEFDRKSKQLAAKQAASAAASGTGAEPAAAAAALRPASSTAGTNDAQAQRDSDAALAAAAAAAGAAAAAAALNMAPPVAAAPKAAAAAAALRGKKPSKRAPRDPQPDLQQLALQQSAVQAAAAEAAMAAAARQQQKAASEAGSAAAAAALAAGWLAAGKATAESSHHDSEDAAAAAAMALTALAGSQGDLDDGLGDHQQYHHAGGSRSAAAAALKKGRAGSSRLANGSGRATHTSPMKAR